MPTPEQASAVPNAPCTVPPDHAKWFKEEVHTHDGQLKSWVRGSFPNVRDVEDVVQESYLRIWKARLLHPVTQTKSFLFQIARNIITDGFRRAKSHRTESLGDLTELNVTTDDATPLDALSYNEKVQLVIAALADLPERCRQIFILRKLEGVSQKEIAQRLGIAERTVESQANRGMQLFSEILRKKGLDGFIRDEK